MDKIPQINTKAVCISCDKGVEISREISKYFIKKGNYFSVFNFIELIESKKDFAVYNDDGFIGQVLGNQGFVYINNAIAMIKPEFVVFAGLNDQQRSFFVGLGYKNIICINNVDDIDKYPDLFDKTKKDGLISSSNEESDNIVVIEDSHDLNVVIAENFAKAMDAKILYVEDADIHIQNKAVKYISEWKEEKKYSSYLKLKNLIDSRVGSIDFSKYKIATFFTNGVPYGLIVGNPIPFCYVKKKLRSDIFIVNNIIYSQKKFGIALCFSVGDFVNAEPKEVSAIFSKNNFFPIHLFNEKFSTFNFEHYTEHIPYDILHISSHGGIKTTAYHVVQKFKDRKSNNHIIEYYEVPTFMRLPLDNSGDIAIYTKTIFLKFDKSPWNSDNLRSKKISLILLRNI